MGIGVRLAYYEKSERVMDMARRGEGSESGRSDIEVVVKWYNPSKGYGFVQIVDTDGDIFLHASVVRLTGYLELPPGTKMRCDINDGPRGPQVAAIHSVTLGSIDGRGASGATHEIEGRVKFFDPERGFGFVVPDDGGQDVFVSARQLERAGIHSLVPEQRVRLTIGTGRKGPVAVSLNLI